MVSPFGAGATALMFGNTSRMSTRRISMAMPFPSRLGHHASAYVPTAICWPWILRGRWSMVTRAITQFRRASGTPGSPLSMASNRVWFQW